MEGEGGDRRLSIYARHFSKKVKLNASKAVIDVNVVYNGKQWHSQEFTLGGADFKFSNKNSQICGNKYFNKKI